MVKWASNCGVPSRAGCPEVSVFPEYSTLFLAGGTKRYLENEVLEVTDDLSRGRVQSCKAGVEGVASRKVCA